MQNVIKIIIEHPVSFVKSVVSKLIMATMEMPVVEIKLLYHAIFALKNKLHGCKQTIKTAAVEV